MRKTIVWIIKKTSKITETLLAISVYVTTIINTLYFNLHKNPSDLTLPQITWQSPSFQSTPYLSKTYLDMCNQLYSVSLINFGPTT